MEYKKLSERISDPVNDNVKALERIFPSAVKDGEVDFEALKEELGKFQKVGKEKYELTWAGKQNAKKKAREAVLGRTLKYVPEESKDADTTQNLYIEGDNLEVLKLLRENYYGSIKMIYIDPPYNTGNDFIYNDDFKMTQEESDIAEGDIDKEGSRLIKNQKSNNRYHAKWLSMMYPRLKLAKDLLSQDGVIFISIDDNETADLRQMCDEIFGEENFVAQFVWKGRGGKQDSKYCVLLHEYILCFAKSISEFNAGEEVKKDEKYLKLDINKNRYYKTQLLRKWGSNSKRSDRPNLFYPIIAPDGTQVYPMLSEHEEGRWRWGKETMAKAINDNNVEFIKKNNEWIPYEKIYEPLKGEEKTKKYTTWIDDVGTTASGSDCVKNLFDLKVFDFPKPIELLKKFLLISNAQEDAIILDFFSGSATTAHAVMQLNAEDGGNRKFIMVQLPEPCDEKSEAYKAGYKNICEIGKERIRRSGNKIKKELEEKQPQNAWQQSMLHDEESVDPDSLDIGFKVFKTGDTNIKWTHEALKSGQIDMDESTMLEKDKLDFMPGFKDIDVVYEVLLRQRDVPLSAKIEKLSSIGDRTYIFAESFVVCLEEKIDKQMIEKLAAVEPLPIKFIFRDSAFEDDIELKDEIFRRLSALIQRNTGESGKAYTVEFI